MKTRNTNISSIFAKASLLIFLAVATGISASAQKSFNAFNLFNLIKIEEAKETVLENTVTAIVEVDLYSNSLDFVLEESMEIKEWMTKSSAWNYNEDNAEIELEEEMNVENWMTSAWNTMEMSVTESVVEEEIPVEDWMSNFNVYSSTEAEIELEAWMYSSDSWK